jgi:LysR family cys regulon transcriptional activator
MPATCSRSTSPALPCRGIWLRDYAYHFIESFVPTLTPDVVRQKLNEDSDG